MTTNCFIFDTNKCVGCMACAVGCTLANDTRGRTNWRTVHQYNPLRHPELPVFHYSLACNHCHEAPCMKNCPAMAYSRDEKTGAVIHDAGSCIGCKYCTWACPYDAPKFNPAAGIVEKCNLCIERISTGAMPACATACPVGALSYGVARPNGDSVVTPGFTQQAIRPQIYLIPPREKAVIPEIITNQPVTIPVESLKSLLPPRKPKITAAREWSLVAFTLLVPVLAASVGAVITHGSPFSKAIFVLLSLLALVGSLLHLGKKQRAWRAVTNLKHSWLSREIISFSAFIGFAFLYLLFPRPLLGWAVIGAALATLISIDFVYRMVRPHNEFPLHSSSAWLTGLLLWSLITNSFFMSLAVIAVKGALYIRRKNSKAGTRNWSQTVQRLLRLVPLLAAPAIILLEPGAGLWAALAALTGETADRIDFYNEAEIADPASAAEKP